MYGCFRELILGTNATKCPTTLLKSNLANFNIQWAWSGALTNKVAMNPTSWAVKADFESWFTSLEDDWQKRDL